MPDSRFRTREIALSGRLRTADDPATIGPNDLSVCKNMRPWDQYPRGIGGMTKINSTPITNHPIKAGVHFSKAQPEESHVVVADSLGRLLKNDTAIPSAGNFDASPIFTPSDGYQSSRLAVVPQGALALCNGVDSIVYGGSEFRCAGFMDNPSASAIYDYSDDVASKDTASEATIHTAGGGGPWVATFYVGSIMPLDGLKLYIGTANTKASTMAVYYYDGDSWPSVGTLDDNTTSGGISLAATGTVTFDSTKDIAKTYNLSGVVLYWYKVVVTAAGEDFSGIPTIYYVTTSVPAQQIQDIWDGESRPAYSALIYVSESEIYDNTTNVSEDTFLYADASTYLLTSSYINGPTRYLMFGFSEHIAGLIFTLGEHYINEAASTVTVEYWNGSAWVAVTGLTDKTLNDAGTKSLSRSGTMSWTYPGDGVEYINMNPFPVHNTTNEINNLYYYRVSFTVGVSATTAISYVRGIPAQNTIKGYSFPLEHQGRTVLCDEYQGERNSILMSAQDTLNVFNGLDSFIFPFGKDDPVVAGASLFLRFGSSVQDMLVLFKKGSMWLLEGNGSTNDPYRKRQFAENIGCVAPGTVTTIPVGDLGGGVRRSFVIWESQRGIEIFDGASLMDPLLSNDIRDKFDPRSSTYAGSYLNTGFYDPVYDEYHWLPVGTSEWVYSFKYKKWFQVDRGASKYLYGSIPVRDTNGNSYIYGYDGAGYMYRLEHGTDFDGNDIVHTLETGDIAFNENKISEELTLRMVKVVQVGKTTANSMTVTRYGNTETVGNVIGSFVPNSGTKRLMSRILNVGSSGAYVHNRFRLELTTDDQAYGCEPIYIVAYYDGERQDVR